jgi:hypothetical protein
MPDEPNSTQPDPAADAAAAAAATPADAAGTAPGSTDAPALPELPFKIDEIEDEQARTYLRTREAQMQAGVNKFIEEQRQRERELQAQVDVLNRIEDEGTRREALKEFNAKYGVELEWEDDPAPDPADTGTPARELDPNDPIQARILQLEAEAEENRAAKAEETAQRQRDRRIQHLDASLGKYAQEEKFGERGQDVPEHHREAIIEIALAQGVGEDGLFDMDRAITTHRARLGQYLSGERERYTGSKDTPHIAIGGGSADPQFDLTDQKDRLKAANLIAQRHST